MSTQTACSTMRPATVDARWREASQATPPGLPARDPGYRAAEFLWENAPLIRAQLEARVLAGQPAHGIALQMGVPPDIVTQYESWFFDVRPYLAEQDWIIAQVPGCRLSQTLACEDLGLLWRRVAVHYGMLMLFPLVAQFSPEKLTAQGIGAYMEPAAPLDLQIKMKIAQLSLPILRTAEGLNRLQVLATDRNWRWRLTDAERNAPLFQHVVALVESAARTRSRAGARR